MLNALDYLDEGRRLVVPEDVAKALPAIVADAEAQLQPMSEDQMQAELTAVMAVLGVGLPQDEKVEWMAGAMVHLSAFPAGLCAEALHECVRNGSSLRSVVEFVSHYCEDYPKRMEARVEKLMRLERISKGEADV